MITAARKQAGLSVREAARRAGISDGWWRQIVLGYQSLSGGGYGPVRGPADTLARMAQVVGVTPEQLIDAGRQDAAAELRDLESAERAHVELPDALARDERFMKAFRRLSYEQQQAHLKKILEIVERSERRKEEDVRSYANGVIIDPAT